ncbi:MAG: DUF2959 domain-containing protein [Planctomycetota bacterium]|nr:DUF2959 domain-containing protein [Planctomycetota bacterium]MDA1137249.1 DUF2959 domain-containing protein [Planctomycetota bacterium]
MKHSATAILLISMACSSCTQVYYSVLEKAGKHKRHILRDRVKAGQKEQEKASKQFESALQQFKSVVNFSGGELEAKYNRLKSEYDSCEARAAAVKNRITSIEQVALDLFAEWKAEIEQFQSEDLKRRSHEARLNSREQYAHLITAMHKAESKMGPILNVFKDHVLFLKHNLNAQAIASLKGQVVTIEAGVTDLIREMEISIAEAKKFIDTME